MSDETPNYIVKIVPMRSWQPVDVEYGLPFNAGDELLVLEKIEEEWYRASLNGKTGIIPGEFVHEHALGYTTNTKSHLGAQQPPETVVSPRQAVKFRVLFDYTATLFDETSVTRNQVVSQVEPPVDGWVMIQKSGGIAGKVPEVYLETEDGTDALAHIFRRAKRSHDVKVLGLETWNADVEYGVSFTEGDVLKLEEMVEQEWWRVEFNNQLGIVPAHLVQVIPPTYQRRQESAEQLSEKQAKAELSAVKYRVLFDYSAHLPDELSLKQNDLVQVVEKLPMKTNATNDAYYNSSEAGDEWWCVKYLGLTGLFPAKMLEVDQGIDAIEMLVRMNARQGTPIEAIVHSEWSGDTEFGLAIKPNDVLLVEEIIQGNEYWRVNRPSDGKGGVVPPHNVHIKQPTVRRRKRQSTSNLRVMSGNGADDVNGGSILLAVDSWYSNSGDGVSFEPGELITLLGIHDNGWRIRVNGQETLLQANSPSVQFLQPAFKWTYEFAPGNCPKCWTVNGTVKSWWCPTDSDACRSMFVPCCVVGQIAEHVTTGDAPSSSHGDPEGSSWLYLNFCTTEFRQQLRQRYDLPGAGEGCSDFQLHTCCYWAALYQEIKEVRIRSMAKTRLPLSPEPMKR